MKRIKHSKNPSIMGGIACIAVAAFGVLWTIAASSITSSFSRIAPFRASAFGKGIETIFPLFGVFFIVVAIVAAAYNFKKGTINKRVSKYYIAGTSEETDSPNEHLGKSSAPNRASVPEAVCFCPFCGSSAKENYRFCNRCGKKLPQKQTD